MAYIVMTQELTADAGRTSVLTSTYDRCAPNQPFEVDTDYQGSDLVKGGFSLTSAERCSSSLSRGLHCIYDPCFIVTFFFVIYH